MNIVKVAIAASGARTQREFGQKLGKGQTAVARYIQQGRFPISVILEVEKLSGIRRDRLAPELFEGYVLAEPRADLLHEQTKHAEQSED